VIEWCAYDVQTMESAIDSDLGPSIDARAAENYRTMKAILQRLTRLCVIDSVMGRKPRKHEQRLLRNMAAHSAVLELLEIPYDKVSYTTWLPTYSTVLELLEIPYDKVSYTTWLPTYSTVLELPEIPYDKVSYTTWPPTSLCWSCWKYPTTR